MNSGYTKAWRKELNSAIWQMPPLYHRVWYWLRQKAQYEPFLFPTRKLFGIWVLPGQRLTSIQQIAEGVKYFDNHREIIPDKRTITRILDWLEFNGCITITSNAFATLIHIINWDTYNHNDHEPVTVDVPPDVLGYVPPNAHKKERKRIKKKEKEGEEEGIEKIIFAPQVSLTQKEYDTLANKYGPDFANACVEKLSNAKQSKGYKYVSDYAAINSWVVDEVKKRSQNGEKPTSFRERVNQAAVDDFINGRY